MKKILLHGVLAATVALSLAVAVGAQGPPPGGFGRRGPGGPGGPMGGGSCTAPCTLYQFTVTITSQEPVLVGGVAKTIPNTTTGLIARDANGSTYRDVKLGGLGPWAAPGGGEELVFIKNLDPSVLMNYVVNVTKGTYEQFPIKPRTPRGNWQGKGPRNGGGPGGAAAPTALNYTVPGIGGFMCKAEQTSASHQIQLPGSGGSATITTNRVYCPELQLVLEEDHSDPRFGTRSYLLSDYVKSPSPQLFQPAGKLVERKKFGRRGGPGGSGQQPPTP